MSVTSKMLCCFITAEDIDLWSLGGFEFLFVLGLFFLLNFILFWGLGGAVFSWFLFFYKEG